jgi:UDP-N-acetylmuramoyl-tripeptide--D-alanyl-D-alanine ligase
MTGDQAVAIDLPLPGLHNLRNALAAAAASLAVGANLEDIRHGLEGSKGIAGRLQYLPGPNGSTLINDAYNANPASLGAALSVVGPYPGVKWLVLGDMAELGSQDAQMHTQAGKQARLAGFHRIYTLGKHSLQAALAFGEGSVHCETAEALIQTLAEALRETNERAILLIKGSRRMRMERVIQGLIETPYRDEL